MRLSRFLDGYAAKVLAPVDLPDHGSNQHEINAVVALRRLLGETRLRGTIHWTYMLDEDGESRQENSSFTYYDSRERHPTRSEWRFFYSGNAVLDLAQPGDLLVILRMRESPSDQLHGFIFPSRSSWKRKAEMLFGAPGSSLAVSTGESIEAREVALAETILLEMLGVGREQEAADIEALANSRFPGDRFPTTRDLAEFARQSLGDMRGLAPDARLELFLKREADLFYAIERRIVGARLKDPHLFSSVEDFLAYSLSVQNRRKARMGASLENHLGAVLREAGLRFDHPGRTEGDSAPDFLFPGTAEYQDSAFPPERLRMLGAKSTCKDRWRQVLAEAQRIPRKHLCTLEPAISVNQTAEMERNGLTLVLPAGLHSTYTPAQQQQILSIEGFIREVHRIAQ